MSVSEATRPGFAGILRLRVMTLLALFLVPIAHGVEEDSQLWGALVVSTDSTEPLSFTTEAHARWTDDVHQLGVRLIRPSLSWTFRPGRSAAFGYAWVHLDPAAGNAVDEHRLWQQLALRLSDPASSVTIDSRTRLEQRWLDRDGEVGQRLRQQLRVTAPLVNTLKAVAWTEAFVALDSTDWGQRRGLERWRNFLGIQFPLGEGVALETGYLNQVVVRRGVEDAMHHAASLTLTARF